MNKTLTFFIFCIGLFIPTNSFAEIATGLWLTDDGKFRIRIENCGKNLCGRLVWLREPLEQDGSKKVDKNNPNPSLRSRPLIGISLLKRLAPTAQGTWKGGIYNPDDGKTYSALLTIVNSSRLKIKGCVLLILCKSLSLKRVGS